MEVYIEDENIELDKQSIKPWITEEYAQERNERIRKLKEEGKDPFTNKYGKGLTKQMEIELQKQSIESAIEFNQKNLDELQELGSEAFIRKTIEEIEDLISSLENPTEHEKYMYTQAYFDDLISTQRESLKFYKNILSNKELLKTTSETYELNRIKHIENLKQKLDKINNITQADLDNLDMQELLGNIGINTYKTKMLLEVPKTKYPNEYIIPKDKISNMLFNDGLSDKLNSLRMEKAGSKKELTAVVNIDYEGLQGLKISRKFNPYDWQVHNSIVSLYVDGGNEYITPLMVYRTMTGNPEAKLTDKIEKAISESVTKCSYTRINIDATKEAEAYKMDKVIYEGNLIYTEKVIGHYNGKTDEWIHIIRRPILYDYANSKDQVARMDIKLLNTPINKNEESITLQGYLQKRILDMKGSRLSKNILYDTVYKQLDINSERYKKLRSKQAKIRDSIKSILDYWKEEGFIKDYKENPGPGNTKVSISIILD